MGTLTAFEPLKFSFSHEIMKLPGFIISWENKNFKGSKAVKVPIKFHANHKNKKDKYLYSFTCQL